MVNIIMIESVLILIITIPILFRLKNWMYKKQNLEIKKWEEHLFLISSFTFLLISGLVFKSTFLLFLSLPFLFWMLVDAINFDIELWRIFLKRLR